VLARRARLIARARKRLLKLDEVNALLASDALVVDACRYAVRDARTWVHLRGAPCSSARARARQAWPSDAPRGTLRRASLPRQGPDESYRARLRVEVGRLRKQLSRSPA